MQGVEVLVLGLGPAGASAAAEAARAGCRVLALDRRREAGRPVQCAELVPALLEVDAAAVRQRVEAMHTFVEDDAPDRTPEFPGRMLDRAAFDAALVQKAVDAGAQCRFMSHAVKILSHGEVLLADGRTFRPRILIGADGPRSRVGRAIGAVNRELVETRQITVPLAQPHAATDIFLSRDIPGGYGWLFPKGETANLGAGVSPPHKARLKSIVARLHAAQAGRVGREVLALTGGAIPVGGLLRAAGRLGETLVLLAGDAAGLANPVSGAGIAAAVHSGRLAGRAAASGDAEGYEEELADVYGASLERAVQRRRQLVDSNFEKKQLRRSWIAYPEYWQ